jgi:hypothetical protein
MAGVLQGILIDVVRSFLQKMVVNECRNPVVALGRWVFSAGAASPSIF